MPALQRTGGHGSFRLGLTGGEPLMRRDLFDVIDAAHDYGLHPCLTTNGLLIDEHVARQLGRRRPLRLSVSLEGAMASTNDAVRGTGTFDRVLANVGILGRHAPFSLAMTVMRTNLDEIEDFAALAREVGAEAAVFRPLYPVGRARQHIESMTTWRQYAEAIDRLAGSLPADACMHSVGPAGSRGGPPAARRRSAAAARAKPLPAFPPMATSARAVSRL